MKSAFCIVVLVLMLSGCASSKPYFEGGLSWPIESSTDYWVHPDRSWQCQPPWVDLELGRQWRNGVKLGLHHESTILCGTWNDKPEIYWNGIRLSKQWGGY